MTAPNRIWIFVVCWILSGSGVLFAQKIAEPIKPIGRTVSESDQFLVFSENTAARMKMANQAETIKEGVRNALRIRDNWKYPILINLEATPPPKQRNPPPFSIGFFQGEGDSIRIQLDVFDREFAGSPQFEVELIRAILLELAYRDSKIVAGKPFQFPPEWAVEAIYERIRSLRSGTRAQVYATLLATNASPQPQEFFRTRPANLDSTSRILYRAEALAMWDMLSDLPDGKAGLQGYLSGPRRNPASMEEVLSFFPSLENDRGTLSRRWLLAIARGSATDRTDLYDADETRKQLDAILDIKALPDPKNPEVAAMSGPYALEAIARSQNGRFVLNQMSESLLRLSLRAHPMYKSLVNTYLQIVRELAVKPRRRVDKRVAAAEEIRAGLRRQNSEVESYMDWIEGTKLNQENEALTTAIVEAEEIEAPPPRPDAISRHLDAVMERGW